MKAYAVVSGVLTLVSACFVDNNIQPFVAKVGRVALVASGVVFLITETIFLITS
ncbi:MAG TPA: hypothetical protein VFK84_09155 [Burkholderiales bacterium]|nr:hypothetical protein [Burkholderiales bacterium]